MRTSKILVLCITAVALCCVCNYAATKLWSYDGGTMIYQTVADGKGGCAFLRIETNLTATVVWLDKKGVAKCVKPLGAVIPSPIIRCSDNQLVYMNIVSSSYFLVQLDKKCGETDITESDKRLTTPWPVGALSYSVPCDNKGFFAISVDTNTNFATLERYSYK